MSFSLLFVYSYTTKLKSSGKYEHISNQRKNQSFTYI